MQLEVIEGSWPSDRGIVILSFRSLRDAELWKDSVPEIRQHDWMDGVDAVIVPITSLPRQYIILLYTHAHTHARLTALFSGLPG